MRYLGDMNKKKLRGAVIGYGFISAKGHIPAYLKRSQDLGDVEIVAVADISPVRETWRKKRFPKQESTATIGRSWMPRLRTWISSIFVLLLAITRPLLMQRWHAGFMFSVKSLSPVQRRRLVRF